MPLSDLFENVSEYTANDIFDMIFHCPYYPTIYIIQCIFTCYYLRKTTTKPGIEWYRSLILGFLLAYSGRYILGQLIARVLPEMVDNSYLKIYLIIWLLFNIFPFDLIFKFFDRTISKWVLSILSGYVDSIGLMHSIWNIINVFPDNNPRLILIIITYFITPMIIHVIDNLIFQENRIIMLQPFHYLKRIIFITIIILFLIQKNYFFPDQPFSQVYHLIPSLAGIMSFLRLIDLIFSKDNPFFIIDYIFPKFFEFFFPLNSLK